MLCLHSIYLQKKENSYEKAIILKVSCLTVRSKKGGNFMDNNNFNDMNSGFESSFSNQPVSNNFNDQPFVAPTYNGPMDTPRNAYDGLEEPVSIGEWVILYLIMMVPCVNIIMLFVWAFGKNEKKSKSNYCKVQLIIMAIFIVLYIIMFVVFGAAMFSGLTSTGSY